MPFFDWAGCDGGNPYKVVRKTLIDSQTESKAVMIMVNNLTTMNGNFFASILFKQDRVQCDKGGTLASNRMVFCSFDWCLFRFDVGLVQMNRSHNYICHFALCQTCHVLCTLI